MNKGKTEFIIIGSGHQIAKCSTSHLNMNNVEVQRSRVIKYLGTHMDEKVSFKDHITAKCRTAAINFCARAQSISQCVDAGQLNVPPQQQPITLSLTKVMLD